MQRSSTKANSMKKTSAARALPPQLQARHAVLPSDACQERHRSHLKPLASSITRTRPRPGAGPTVLQESAHLALSLGLRLVSFPPPCLSEFLLEQHVKAAYPCTLHRVEWSSKPNYVQTAFLYNLQPIYNHSRSRSHLPPPLCLSNCRSEA